MGSPASSNLQLRRQQPADTQAIWGILGGAIAAMAAAGRDQWQQGYPAPENVAHDLRTGVGRVLVEGGSGRIVGFAALVTDGEPCYDAPYDGDWLTRSHSSAPTYSCVHRLAIDPALTGRGLAKAMMRLMLDESRRLGCRSMRIDTNHDNVQMLHLLPQLGFERCCKVRLAGGERIAFELLLEPAQGTPQ